MDEITQGIPAELHSLHVEQYFGPWAMKEDVFRSAFDRVSRMDLRVHLEKVQQQREVKAEGEPQGPSYPVTETGIAVLQLTGTLMKIVGSLESGTSTVMFRRKLRAAMSNPAIAGILILIDSPGGSVAGTYELAEDIAAAAKKKPTHAFIQDLGASAAYWAASQATVISANVMAIVGSIGTFMPVYDFSGWAAKEGIRVEIVREGEFKGAGTPGTKVTEEQVAEWQRTVTALNAQFVAGPYGVSRGRGISSEEAKKLNDGRVHVGAVAKTMGLIDHVETFEKAVSRLESVTRGKPSSGARAEEIPEMEPKSRLQKLHERRNPSSESDTESVSLIQDEPKPAGDAGANEPTAEAAAKDVPSPEGADALQTEQPSEKGPEMSGQNNPAPAAPAAEQPKAATMAELKAACPGAAADFLVEQSEKSATTAQAKDAFIGWQAAQIRDRDQQISATPKAAAAKVPGVPAAASAAAEQPRKNGSGGDESATAEFEQRVSERMKLRNEPRHTASQNVLANDDDLRERYNAEQGEQRKERIGQRRAAAMASAR